MFALIDGNNFYVSCERIFDPGLRRRPVCVLSNNDGCAIARSQEAKDLGIKMGQPAHELRHLVRQKGLILRSANFRLYGDISARVLSIARDMVPRVEPYSIDENFLDLSGVPDPFRICVELRQRVHQWTGIPNCVGLAPTKTLAKLANRLAKKGDGVVDLSDRALRNRILDGFPAEDIWGVGRRLTERLRRDSITTAGELRDAPADLLLQRYGVVMARTQRELQGHSCIELEEVAPDKQQIVVSRSFGDRVESHDEVAEALATFAVRACEKAREGGLVAGAVQVFAGSDRFRPELAQHHPQRTAQFPSPTADTRLVLGVIRHLLVGMLRDGIGYKRGGVCLMDLGRAGSTQQDLFAPANAGDPKLMAAMDAINAKFGRGAIGLAATGWQAAPAWGMRQEMRSQDYTTDPRQLPRVRC